MVSPADGFAVKTFCLAMSLSGFVIVFSSAANVSRNPVVEDIWDSGVQQGEVKEVSFELGR